VTYQMLDKCGNTETCSFDVNVETALQVVVPEDITVACNGATSCCNDCPTPGQDIPGFVYMGRRNGHQYYCSKEPAMWQTANTICTDLGGYLASINSADENDFIAAFLTTQNVFIGLSDAAQEGNFVWASGEPRTYNNWYTGQPNNLNGNQDYVQMLSSGAWDDIYNNKQLEFVLELPCTDVYQIEGPENGDVFPVGTTTVTYKAEDKCGTITTNSFDVTVTDCTETSDFATNYCHAQGTSTEYLWIDHLKLGEIDNCTGKDYGYGDYTSHSTVITPGSMQSLYCYPGFANRSYYVYWTCWIDYNGDGDFDDVGEEVFTYRHYQALKINFRVPQTCRPGQTRMRVAMKYGNPADDCEVFEHGEVEDYTIVILSEDGLRDTRISESRSNDTYEVVVLEDAEVAAPTGEVLPSLAVEAGIATATTVDLAVYPNPVQSVLHVDIANYATENGQLTIFNQLGQLVHTATLTADAAQQVQVDVRDYIDGMYYIQVANGKAAPIVKQFEKVD